MLFVNVYYAEEQIMINKKVLLSVMKTFLLCGKQGLALRGSNDDDVLGDDNDSNFNELLKFKIDALDEVLKNHLGNCKPNPAPKMSLKPPKEHYKHI